MDLELICILLWRLIPCDLSFKQYIESCIPLVYNLYHISTLSVPLFGSLCMSLQLYLRFVYINLFHIYLH